MNLQIRKNLAWLLAVIGVFLTAVNIYGLTQNIRVDDFSNQYLRFANDQPVPFQQSIVQTTRLPGESDKDYATRATKVVSEGLSHIEWLDFPSEQFNQLIPIWENYFLYFMGKFSGIPEFERYHYANYERSLKRGIGLCGDASMTLSQLLGKENIDNKILTFPGHVVVYASFNDGSEYILDPDFGVVVPFLRSELLSNNIEIAELYRDAGYTQGDVQFFTKMYTKSFKEWDGVQHFITKKYYFEKVSYWLKWPLPIVILLVSLMFLLRWHRLTKR